MRKAKGIVSKIREKKIVHRKLLDFLVDDNLHSDSIVELLDRARVLKIDEDFIRKVDDVFADVKPKLEIRNKLRRSIENVNLSDIMDSILRADEMIKKMVSQCEAEGDWRRKKACREFCRVEKEAGERILNLVHFEKELLRDENSSAKGTDEQEGIEVKGRLSETVLKLCDAVSSAASEEEKRNAVGILRANVDGSAVVDEMKFEEVVRSYKWSRIYASWKFNRAESGGAASSLDYDGDEFPLESKADRPDEFFGLRPRELHCGNHIVDSYDLMYGGEEQIRGVEKEVQERRGGKSVKSASHSLMRTAVASMKRDKERRKHKDGTTSKVKFQSPTSPGKTVSKNAKEGGKSRKGGLSYSLLDSTVVDEDDTVKKMRQSRRRVEQKRKQLLGTLAKLQQVSGKQRGWR